MKDGYAMVDVKDLDQPIRMTIPYHGDSPINEIACAYYNTDVERYVELECTSSAHNIGILNSNGKSMKCCSNHATAFTVMERDLLKPIESEEEAASEIDMQMIAIIVAGFLVATLITSGICYCIYYRKKNRSLLAVKKADAA